jgi:hypothetical protein
MAALALQACGGGGGGGGGSSGDNTASPSSQAQVQGVVYDADSGQPLEGATLRIGTQTATTDSHGQFELSASANQKVDVRATLEGYAEGQAPLSLDGKGGHVTLTLTRIGATSVLDIAAGGTATLNGSTSTQLVLPADALVDAATQQHATGQVRVSLTAIDPGTQPGALPGGYKADNGGLFESFGAIQVQLKDAATGKALQLASNKVAIIRIPVKTRSAETPASVPLSFFNERTGLWIQEGSADRKGDASSGYFYEGRVSRLGTWSADRSIGSTVLVKGCVRDASNQVPNVPVTVTLEGLSYSGQALATMAADGSFAVALKREADARLSASSYRQDSPAVLLAPSTADVDLRRQCLVLSTPPSLPVIVQQPMVLGVAAEGLPALLAVNARGPGPLRYQWQRDGVDLPGQTNPVLALPSVRMSDDGARFSVVVRSGDTSVPSDDLTLSVFTRQALALQDLSSGIAMALPMSISAATVVNFFNFTVKPADQVCKGGTISAMSLDGVEAHGGEEVLLDTTERKLDITFAGCTPVGVALAELSTPLTGTVSSHYFLGPANALVNSADLAMDDAIHKLHFAGKFDSGFTLTSLFVTPAVGATVTHASAYGGSNTLTFAGGQVAATFKPGIKGGKVTFRNVQFNLHGVAYVLTGQFSLPEGQADDDVHLQTPDGASIAHLRYDVVKKQPFVDITGTVPSF